MTPTRLSTFSRGLTWLLAAAFILASLPAPVFAQEMEPAPDPALPAEGDVPPLGPDAVGVRPRSL